MTRSEMSAFWDARARENAPYFVDNRLDYHQPDWDAFWRGGEEDLTRLLELLDLSIAPDAAVVEIGCGLGRLTRALAARAASVVAVDVSPEMLASAQEHNPGLAGVTWRLGDGESLPGVEDASADGVFSHVVFQHVPSAEITYGYVREMGRVLRPGGWAAFQVSDDPAVHRPEPLRRRVARRLRRGPRGATHEAWRGSAVDLDRLRDVAAAAGLEVERILGEGTQFCLVRLRRRA